MSLLNNHLLLIKFYLSLAVSSSACVGYALHQSVSALRIIILFLGVFFMSAAASALNQFVEQKTDKLMIRTANRPLASGQTSNRTAFLIIGAYFMAGCILLFLLHWLALFLGIANIFLYNFVYTPLKYKSIHAIFPGAVVGLIPPLIGWFSSGYTFPSMPVFFFITFMFLWQIPHFIILSIKYKEDYQRAGIKSISNFLNSQDSKSTALIWLLGLCICSLMFPFAIGFNSSYSLLCLIIINLIMGVFLVISFNQKTNYIPEKTNVFIHLYLVINFILIIL